MVEVVSSHYQISLPDGLAVTLLQVLLSDRSFIHVTSILGSWTPSCTPSLHIMSSAGISCHHPSPHWSTMGTAVCSRKQAGVAAVAAGATCCMMGGLGLETRNPRQLWHMEHAHSSFSPCPEVLEGKSTSKCTVPVLLPAEHGSLSALINSPAA